MHFFRDILRVCVESEPPGTFLLTSVCLHGTTEKQRRGIWFHFDQDFPHFPDPSCGFRDSGDLSLFWITGSYQGKRRHEDGGVLQLEGVIFNSSVLQVFNSHSKKC